MSYGKDVYLFIMIEIYIFIFKFFKEVYVLFMDYLMYCVIKNKILIKIMNNK